MQRSDRNDLINMFSKYLIKENNIYVAFKQSYPKVLTKLKSIFSNNNKKKKIYHYYVDLFYT